MATKISRLKSDASAAANSRGHDMTRFIHHEFKNNTAISHCRNCHMSVTVNTHPAPNEIDIGGEAVALTCQVTPNLGLATYCIKVIPENGKPYFHYIDSMSHDEVESYIQGSIVGVTNNFAQVGLFYTDVELHRDAREAYLAENDARHGDVSQFSQSHLVPR